MKNFLPPMVMAPFLSMMQQRQQLELKKPNIADSFNQVNTFFYFHLSHTLSHISSFSLLSLLSLFLLLSNFKNTYTHLISFLLSLSHTHTHTHTRAHILSSTHTHGYTYIHFLSLFSIFIKH